MKKFIAILTVTALIFTLMAIPVHAAEPGITKSIDVTPENVFVQDGDGKDVTIPVYGYVGEDAVITDPDKDKPHIPPIVTPAEINVSVPVKIIWAAFESDKGDVTAPTYHIKNNSTTPDYNLIVTLTSFDAENPHANAINSALSLHITGAEMATPNVIGITNAKTFEADFSAQARWEFSLSGTYDGNFDIAYTPTYSMVLTFALDEETEG